MAQQPRKPASSKYPELVMQKAHGPGVHEEHSFEDALRDLVRNSPYLGISLLLHIGIFVIMAMMQEPLDIGKPDIIITATSDVVDEQIPDEPVEPPPVEEVETLIEEPTISDHSEVSEDVVDSDESAGEFESTGANDVIGVGGGGGSGFGRGRGKVGKRGGGGSPHNQAILDALRWLKNHQSPDGYWSCEGFEDECGKQGDGACGGRGSVHHDVGVTSLALLAFLGAGHHPNKKDEFTETVKNGLKFLRDVQDSSTGNFNKTDFNTNTYDHFLATLAMIEASVLAEDNKFKRLAEKGLDYAYSLRNPGRAWRYSDPTDPEMVLYPDDVSVTGWAVMAMTMAKEYGLKVDDVALEDSLRFIDEMTGANGRTGYWARGDEKDGGPSRPKRHADANRFLPKDTESMTAVGVLCRIFADPDLSRTDLKNREDVELGVKLMLDLPILWDEEEAPDRIDFYYWYYATYALYQVGGEPWNRWQASIKVVAEKQIREGEAKGSWDPQVDVWSDEGGRVYSTAILCLLLEVYNRYDTVMGSHGK